MTLSLWRERPSGREDGRTKKRAARRLARSLRFFYAALRGLLAAGFGSTFFCSLAFSFAANSCFTLRAMASVSTLYVWAAARRTLPPSDCVDLVQLAYKVLSATKRALPRSVAYQDHYLTEQEIVSFRQGCVT